MKTEGKLMNILLWTLQILSAALFIMAGSSKLAGSEQVVEMFQAIGLGQWFRYLTGGLEVIGGIALLIPQMALFGALLLAVVMVGAVITHLFVVGGSPAMALVLLLVMSLIAWGRRGTIARQKIYRRKEVTA
jgi:putative oxidoreductase